ncbi:hypothetical protein C8C83_4952 [Flavobacterium sp. 90]|uniref:hypothetical protein n=1 Tax=unclassified Flavobacterium TaxID=196869 RepID=UPI000EAB7DC7|nr:MULTISPECIES: hypothetical protein [unclassified Flavobacterium]RKR05598.1 hypothetical protein C8C82_5293 [Flavobacterium sp. 81]TCK56914.1 hypothetical protein C8C83_4952 [Flavobacterium sp. 90]
MGQYITLIFADEKIEIDNKIPHFYEDGYLIIPYKDETRSAVERLQDICKEGMTLDELFNFYIDTEFILNEDNKTCVLEEYEGLNTDLDDLEEIDLVEFLKRLNLSDFTVLSYDDLAGDYILNFENYSYKNLDPESNRPRIRMDKPYLYKYGGCLMHCLKDIEARGNNFTK